MAIKTRAKDLAVIVDPLSFMAAIEIVSGNVSQIYNQDTKEYEADRRVLPCVLMPSVSVSDVDGVMSGKRPITGCEWFEGEPKADGSNRIANGEKYEISAKGKPQWSLSVKKNFEPNIPTDIHAVFTITDTRRGTEVKIERSISFYTAFYDVKILSLRLMDQPNGWVIDPLRVQADASGKWLHTISVQLFSGTTPVDDANAAYWWQIHDETAGWRDFTQDEKDIFITGENTKVLTFDARFIRKESFRCRAAHYTTEKPTVPKSDALTVISTVKVEMPKTLRADIRQLAGAKVDAALNTTVKYECVLSDNVGIISNDKNDLFLITWMALSGKPGAKAKVVGTGRTISFVPSSLGFDKKFSIAVYAEVKMYAVRGLVTNGGKVMVSGGKAVTTNIYE